MKTIILKSVLPAGALLLAVAGAFASQTKPQDTAPAVIGWVDAPTPCHVQFSCANTGSDICTAMYLGQPTQVFGKNTGATSCARVLTRE